VAKKVGNQDDFVAPAEKAKSHVVAQIVRIARKERLNYANFLYVCRQARRKLGLRKPKQERKLLNCYWRPEYRDRADIAQHVHPHLFRHQMLTYLTTQGLSDAQIQVISGHESKKSQEVYQHLSGA